MTNPPRVNLPFDLAACINNPFSLLKTTCHMILLMVIQSVSRHNAYKLEKNKTTYNHKVLILLEDLAKKLICISPYLMHRDVLLGTELFCNLQH